MFNNLLNRRNINKVSNKIFEEINLFFIGNKSIHQPSIPVDDNPFTEEWILNQDVSDIVIKDISVSLGYFLPSILKERMMNLKKNILLNILVDDLEEDIFEEKTVVLQEGFGKVEPKIVFVVEGFKQRISTAFVSIWNWWQDLARKVATFLGINEENPTYYLIGNFSPNSYSNQNDFYKGSSSDSLKVKLKTGFQFHKRN